MENWVKERFGTYQKNKKLNKRPLIPVEIRDLLDDCMEGKDDRTARKKLCQKNRYEGASKQGVIKLAGGRFKMLIKY